MAGEVIPCIDIGFATAPLTTQDVRRRDEVYVQVTANILARVSCRRPPGCAARCAPS